MIAATQSIRGATDTFHCKQCGVPFVARVADRKRGWAKFCDKQCAATYKAGGRGVSKKVLETAQTRNEVLGLSWAERNGLPTVTVEEDGTKVVSKPLPNGGYLESREDPMTGEVSIEEFDRHGMSSGFYPHPDFEGGAA